MPWMMQKVALPNTTGRHTVQVPDGGKIMGASGGLGIGVIFMAPDGASPVDADFEVVMLGESLPSYDKHDQHILDVVDVGADLFCVFECVSPEPTPEPPPEP